MTHARGEIKVQIEITRLQRIAQTKAPLCGVQWMERAQSLVVPTRLLIEMGMGAQDDAEV